MIIGLTGRNAAGKGAVSDYLKDKLGFRYTSLSGPLRPLHALRLSLPYIILISIISLLFLVDCCGICFLSCFDC